MKLLLCRSSECASQGAMLAKSTAYPNGEPYLSGRYVADYHCARCGGHNTLTPAEYNGLRTLNLSDFERMGLRDRATRDLEGALAHDYRKKAKNLKAHAADLFSAGIRTADDVAELERGE